MISSQQQFLGIISDTVEQMEYNHGEQVDMKKSHFFSKHLLVGILLGALIGGIVFATVLTLYLHDSKESTSFTSTLQTVTVTTSGSQVISTPATTKRGG
ncbi:unnamed protein product [Rotaria socialis]|uniref:Uncharacterized protein n=1 Tax=Rotaria socialis TaxID=392032 RepID=A0A818AZX6_9BILA|nr:unnamed protein product [Rotaria socialis]CAF3409525.1 unnamed protein product [Rotaria socialis]CAF4247909.1 unnamed protein product [Rotaria socialis]CAF4278256.1 unnamed protein product [Rotaria socialis]